MWGIFRKRGQQSDEAGRGSADAERARQDAQTTDPITGIEHLRDETSVTRNLDANRRRRSDDGNLIDLDVDARDGRGDGLSTDELRVDPKTWVANAVAQRGQGRPARADDGDDLDDDLAAGLDGGARRGTARNGASGSPADAAARAAADAEREAADRARAIAEEAAARAAAQRETLTRWLDELAVVGGVASLRFFTDDLGTYIELTNAHPSGIAPLLAGKTVTLSSLVRENAAFRAARDAADLIAQKSSELVAGRGISATALATGFAEWTSEDGIHHRAPILTRPISIRRLGRDYELTLKNRARVNTELVRALSSQFGVRLRSDELLSLAEGSDAFLPQAVFDHVRELADAIPGFTVSARAVVSSFGDIADAMLRDAPRDLEHPVVRALAGDEGARSLLGVLRAPADRLDPDKREPATDRLLLDADTEQEAVVDAITAGNSIVVNAMPGTGITQTVINAIGSLAAAGKRVLVVTPRSASQQEIRARLRSIGLDGLVVTPRTIRRDSWAALNRSERAERPQSADLDDALVRLRHVLANYRTALTRRDPELGVSVLDALEELSRLELRPDPPVTTARLDRETLVRLAGDRSAIAAELRTVGALGQFRYGPDDSPWYGVAFPSTEAANRAQRTARDLASGRTSKLIENARELIGRTQLRPAETFSELGVYVRLLIDIRESLDRFNDDVFDHSLADVIQATGPRREGSDMTSAQRRQLRQVAKDLVRPGLSVDDLHEALKHVQRQRILWHRYVVDGSRPTVPTGIEEIRREHRAIAEEMRELDQALVDAGNTSLADVPLDEMPARLEDLAAESEVLHNLVERLSITERLSGLGLEPLLTDLSERHVGPDQASDELELAWWQSVLEDRLSADKSLLNANTRTTARLEGDFRVVDDAHIRGSARELAWQLAQAWQVAIVDEPEQAAALRSMLMRKVVAPSRLVREAGDISRSITPVWLTTPYDLPLVPSKLSFDAVLVVDAAAISTAEGLGAARRAPQIVAFADPVTEFPAPFSLSVQTPGEVAVAYEETSEADVESRIADSLYARLAEFLTEFRLTRSYRAGGEDLVELVNERYYGGQIKALPWAGTFLGHPSLSFSFVEQGTGMPDQFTGAIESTDAEVSRVVDLVIDHAIHRPRESLMVITVSTKHAQRLQQAVYSAVSKRADIAPFFTREHSEQFLITTLELATAQSRDRVVFTLGYGRTPHGRVLSSFGVLGTAMGERALAVGMTRARRSLVIVSCVRPHELDLPRLRRGTLDFARILAEAEREPEPPAAFDEDLAPMLVDLAKRLEALGMRVELDYRGAIPLAASYGSRAIAIDTDAVGAGTSLAEVQRLLGAAALERRAQQPAIRLGRADDLVPADMSDEVNQTVDIVLEDRSDDPDAGPDGLIGAGGRGVVPTATAGSSSASRGASKGGAAAAADPLAGVERPTLRESLRLRPELLKRLGWYYLRVHSFELFANPDAIAHRIASALEVPARAPHELDGRSAAGARAGGEGSARGVIDTASRGASSEAAQDASRAASNAESASRSVGSVPEAPSGRRSERSIHDEPFDGGAIAGAALDGAAGGEAPHHRG